MKFGGKHPYLSFYFKGQRRITVSASPSDRRAIHNLMAEIRRELGEPPPSLMSNKRRMEDMMPEPQSHFTLSTDQTTVQTKIVGTVAYYNSDNTNIGRSHSNSRVNFTFPNSFLQTLNADSYGIKRDKDGSWEFLPGKGRSKPRPDNRSNSRITFGKINAGVEQPFGRTACEYIVVDDHVLVSLTEEMRPVGMSAAQPAVHKTVDQGPARSAAKARGHLRTAYPEWREFQFDQIPISKPETDDISRAQMQSMVRLLNRVEATTEWRLVKVNGLYRLRISDITE
jgi:hypothetical protein